jgi:hypothetical protein
VPEHISFGDSVLNHIFVYAFRISDSVPIGCWPWRTPESRQVDQVDLRSLTDQLSERSHAFNRLSPAVHDDNRMSSFADSFGVENLTVHCISRQSSYHKCFATLSFVCFAQPLLIGYAQLFTPIIMSKNRAQVSPPTWFCWLSYLKVTSGHYGSKPVKPLLGSLSDIINMLSSSFDNC